MLGKLFFGSTLMKNDKKKTKLSIVNHISSYSRRYHNIEQSMFMDTIQGTDYFMLETTPIVKTKKNKKTQSIYQGKQSPHVIGFSILLKSKFRLLEMFKFLDTYLLSSKFTICHVNTDSVTLGLVHQDFELNTIPWKNQNEYEIKVKDLFSSDKTPNATNKFRTEFETQGRDFVFVGINSRLYTITDSESIGKVCGIKNLSADEFMERYRNEVITIDRNIKCHKTGKIDTRITAFELKDNYERKMISADDSVPYCFS